MIELTVLNYLASRTTAPCYMEIPAEMPDNFYLIEKTGSGETDRLSRATIAIQSYSTTMYNAAALNEEVKTIMKAAPENVTNITRSSLNSDYNFTDTANKRYRYQAVFDLVYYEEE